MRKALPWQPHLVLYGDVFVLISVHVQCIHCVILLHCCRRVLIINEYVCHSTGVLWHSFAGPSFGMFALSAALA